MFIITPKFKFLDVINYLGPGTSYDKWVKAYIWVYTNKVMVSVRVI